MTDCIKTQNGITRKETELKEKLTQYERCISKINNLYRGNIKKNKEKSKILVEGRAGREFLKILIEDKELTKLAQLWISGVEIDWLLLHPNKPQRISLPTYPFAKERYWFSKQNIIDEQISEKPRATIVHVDELLNQLQQDLLKSVSEILRVAEEKIDLEASIRNYGADSISDTVFINKINEMYNIEVIQTLFYEYTTIASVALFLYKEYQDSIRAYYQASSKATSEKIETSEEVIEWEEIEL